MKKTLFIGLALLIGANLAEAKSQFGYEAAQKEAFIPYYMKSTDSSKINAIKTDQAGDGCHDDCSSSQGSIVPKQQFINLNNATTNKTAQALITVIAKN